jgi:hypothetical protein
MFQLNGQLCFNEQQRRVIFSVCSQEFVIILNVNFKMSEKTQEKGQGKFK